MVKLTLTATEADAEHTATGETFAKAAVELLKDLLACYEDVIPAVFEALAELSADENENFFSHSDFSMPEENFRLEVTRS